MERWGKVVWMRYQQKILKKKDKGCSKSQDIIFQEPIICDKGSPAKVKILYFMNQLFATRGDLQRKQSFTFLLITELRDQVLFTYR